MSRHHYCGRGLPLERNNVDTDQIMPARFCYKPTRTGHAQSVFGDWREDPKFVLNDARYQGATILVAGREFAVGSSREYAVWGLKDYGFDVVLAPSFGDIFYKNCFQNNLLPLKLAEPVIAEFWQLLARQPDVEFQIDLHRNLVGACGREYTFDIEPHFKQKYLANKSDIELTLEHLGSILDFEKGHLYAQPVTSEPYLAER